MIKKTRNLRQIILKSLFISAINIYENFDKLCIKYNNSLKQFIKAYKGIPDITNTSLY